MHRDKRESLEDHWELLDSRTVYEHSVLRVRKDHYRLHPEGREGDFIALDMRDWVNIIPVTSDREIVLVRQFRHGTRQMSLETPGGVIDSGETPEMAAVRELREETGYVAESVRLLASIYPNPALQQNRGYFVLAERCRKLEATELDPFEDIECIRMTHDQLQQAIRTGILNHGLPLLGLAYYDAAYPGCCTDGRGLLSPAAN
ncbi:MAG: NUDIX hydrolase [Thermoguttaceae bacterium]|nr:NUDIX hydrolase [Thermoguttaceae bacterium]